MVTERPCLNKQLDSKLFLNYYNTYIRDFFEENKGRSF